MTAVTSRASSGFCRPSVRRPRPAWRSLANFRTRLRRRVHGAEPALIADGVWVVRGGFPLRAMNVYLIQEDDGVTMFDGGIADMTPAVGIGAARLGGVKRIVLGHVDADHRGAVPGLGAPVYCHAAEQAAAQSSSAFRNYWDLTKLARHGRAVLGRLLPIWDGGPVTVAETVQEGDEIAGFKVVHLPGHAPGLIGLFREVGQARPRIGLLLHTRSADGHQGCRASPTSRVQLRHRAGARLDPQACRSRAVGRVGRPRRTGDRRRSLAARACRCDTLVGGGTAPPPA